MDERLFPVGMRTLSVAKSGTGSGSIASSPFGINCGLTCTNGQYQYVHGSIVTLNAAPATNSYFAGWSGDCVSQALSCKVTVDAVKNVTASFTTTPPVVATWAKTYGGSSNDVLNSIQQTSDEGYIMAGQTTSFGAGSGDAWIMKLDSNVTPVWLKTLAAQAMTMPIPSSRLGMGDTSWQDIPLLSGQGVVMPGS